MISFYTVMCWVEDKACEAADIMEKYRLEQEILKTPHPPNSLDLNMIEGLWDNEKIELKNTNLR